MAVPTVTLGGKLWHLRFDMNAIAELEGALRLTIKEIGSRLMRGKMGTREARALVWAGILHENEDLGIRQVGDWLHEAGFLKDESARDALLAKVFEALVSAFPEQKPATGGNDPN